MGRINEELAQEAAAAGVQRAVETGTFLGESAMTLARIFDRVETIELSRYLAFRSTLRLLRLRNVHLRRGDSRTLLKPSTEPTLYWLDGHWSAANTAGADAQCPVLEEIRATSPGTFGDWYLIDDATLFTKPVPPPLDPAQWPTIDEVRDVVRQNRSDYSVEVRETLDLIIVRPAEFSRDVGHRVDVGATPAAGQHPGARC